VFQGKEVMQGDFLRKPCTGARCRCTEVAAAAAASQRQPTLISWCHSRAVWWETLSLKDVSCVGVSGRVLDVGLPLHTGAWCSCTDVAAAAAQGRSPALIGVCGCMGKMGMTQARAAVVTAAAAAAACCAQSMRSPVWRMLVVG
jgi:hypothetical protein